MSVGAFDVLKGAEVFETLEEALADVSLAIGTTSGNQREFPQDPIYQSAMLLAESRSHNLCAVVFGDEVNGLSRAELQRCHRLTTVPTNPEFAALNLAQAVAICAYEISRAFGGITKEFAQEYSTGAMDDALFAKLEELLERAGFTRSFNKGKVLTELRSFYQRAQPTKREAELLIGAVIRVTASAASTDS